MLDQHIPALPDVSARTFCVRFRGHRGARPASGSTPASRTDASSRSDSSTSARGKRTRSSKRTCFSRSAPSSCAVFSDQRRRTSARRRLWSSNTCSTSRVSPFPSRAGRSQLSSTRKCGSSCLSNSRRTSRVSAARPAESSPPESRRSRRASTRVVIVRQRLQRGVALHGLSGPSVRPRRREDRPVPDRKETEGGRPRESAHDEERSLRIPGEKRRRHADDGGKMHERIAPHDGSRWHERTPRVSEAHARDHGKDAASHRPGSERVKARGRWDGGTEIAGSVSNVYPAGFSICK